MKKQATLKETKDLPQMTQEDFLEKFYDGKINYKLPSKYPENFALCKTYNDGKKEIPLTHRDKVGAILKDAYNAVKPLVKKFKLSLALLVESNVTYKGVAWTKRIRIDFSAPGATGKREELIAYTSMIQIKIRNKEFPQNPKKFLNRTTILAILLHELAHTRHMHHGIEFALFLKEMFEYAMTLGIFPENEEHMIPSSRAWERRMFETKGSMTREELDTFFEGEAGNAENMDDEHGHEWEEQEENKVEESKMTEEKGDKVSKVSQVSKVVSVKGVGGKTGVGSQQNKSEIGTVKKNVGGKALGGMKDGKMEVEKKGKVGGKEVIGSKKAVTKDVKEDVKEVKEVQEVEKNEMKVENEGEVRGDVIKMEVENVEVQVA